ncbi:MAG: GTPase ObgE [Desulfobacterales bacterium]|nr:GTPase ObgE [Desulfobacteraceae bacterium]MBT7084611.1 GTPase ObgE [Desulfobacterales bacterium]MBT7696301.1 GTPase ObgE [Desulfobacterales bacterium]
MKFIDEATITVESGAGGRGCVSFRREKFIERGGPDGGDGGRGGSVIFKTTHRKRTLYDFRNKNIFKAQRGGHGQGKQKHGKSGSDLVVEIPPGTIISDADSGEILHDFIDIGETITIAAGGRGGQGNKRFTTSRNRSPRFAQPGEPGIKLSIKLELKILADVGIIGFPNAGKSTLISSITAARPKIGNYPFTTLTPNLGVVQTGWGDPFVLADIPGLIEGAHDGAGLGIRFLKHIERTRILLHLIDATEIDHALPLRNYHAVNNELAQYNSSLATKPQLVVINKLDMPDADKAADIFCSEFNGDDIFLISAKTGQGIKQLESRLIQLLDNQLLDNSDE